jgi:D-glycero-D-manno-heptose 1,7-bisphosphate phosphatase
MLAAVGGHITEIFICPHHPDEGCACRKPEPGMLFAMQKKYGLPFAETYFIGDSIGDMRAAQGVGCHPVLVLTGNGKLTLAKHPDLAAIPCFPDLATAAEAICHGKMPPK